MNISGLAKEKMNGPMPNNTIPKNMQQSCAQYNGLLLMV